MAVEHFDALLQPFALRVGEVGVEEGGLVGEAVPVVGDDAAVSGAGLEGPGDGAGLFPATVGVLRRDVGLGGFLMRRAEADVGESGFGRDIGGGDGDPPGFSVVVLVEAVVFGEGDEGAGVGVLLCDEVFVPAVAEGGGIEGGRASEGIPGDGDPLFSGCSGGVDSPGGSASSGEGVYDAAGGVESGAGGCIALEPGFDAVPEGALIVGGDLVDDGGVALVGSREGGGGDAGVGGALIAGGEAGGDVLGLHLEGAIGAGGTGVEEEAGEVGVVDGGSREEIGGEEGDGAPEVGGVEEEGPAVVSGGDVFSGGGGLGVGEGQGVVSVSEELSTGALLEIKAIGGPEEPGGELGDGVLALRAVPVTALAGAGAVGPGDEVQGDAAHDELGGFGGEAGVAPPAEASFDVGVQFALGLWIVVLGVHPGAEEAGLETIARVFGEQGPCGDVHGEAGVVGFGDSVVGDEEVAGHFALLELVRRGEQRRQGQGEQEGEGGDGRDQAVSFGHQGLSGRYCFISPWPHGTENGCKIQQGAEGCQGRARGH